MKKVLLIAVALLATMTVSAQDAEQGAGKMYVKPMVGGTLSTLISVGDVDVKFKPGIVAGGEFGYGIMDKLDITAGMLVAMQGVKYKDTQYTKDYSCTTTMLNFPILGNYYIAKGLALKAGIQPGFLLGQKVKFKEKIGNGEWESYSSTSKEGTKKFDFSIPVGASYEFYDFIVDARFNLGLTKVADGGDHNPKNAVFLLTVGYKIPL